MRFAKLAATATALSLVGAATLVSPAHAATVSGVGTSAASSSLLDVALGTAGSVLNVRLLADDARSTIDPSVAAPEAFSRLNVASITSNLLPAPLNNIQVPIVESRSPGGSGNVASPGLNLANPVAGLSVPAALLGGVLAPASLTSGVDATGAHSALTSALGNISLVGGLISATGFDSTLGTAAKTGQADGTRTIKANAVNVLDLGSLLNGLGIPLGDLPISAVSGLLSGLGLPLPALPTALDLSTFTTQLTDTLTALTAQLAAASGGNLTSSLPVNVTGILGGLPLGGLPIPVSGNPVSAVTGVITTVQGLLSSVLSQAMSALDGVSLLSADGIEVGTVTRATNTVSGSAADVVAKIGSIKIGGLTALPGLDLTSTLAQVSSVTSTITSTLAGVLGSISPDLANLVQVGLFTKDPATGVTSANGYTKSLAGITALTAKIVPPLNLDTIVGGLTSQAGAANGIGSILGAIPGASVPGLSTVMGTFNGLLGNSPLSAISALTGGATLKLASVTSGASFTTPVASTNGSLPRTGGTAQMALLGMALVIAAIASRRFVLAHRAPSSI